MARNSILWKFENPIGNTFYLLGTIHLNSDDINFRREELEKIWPVIDEVYTESDLEEMAQLDFQKKLLLPENKHISDYITARKYQRFEKFINRFTDLHFSTVGRYHPMVLQNIITQGLLHGNSDLSPDEFIHKWAKESNKPIHGLESAEEQLNVFRKIELDYQLIAFKRFMQDISGARRKLNKQIRLYNQGRIHQLYQITKRSLGELKQLMLFERNERMVNRILQLSSDKNLLIAVGAAHLSGGKGILHLCNERGISFKAL